MVNTSCAALNCPSSSKENKSLKFHQFPHDAERRLHWINACKRTDVLEKDWDYFKHKYVCSLHFNKYMYIKNNRLKKTAIPSLNLSTSPIKHESFTQTTESIENISAYHTFQEPIEGKKGQSSQNDVSILYVQDIRKNLQLKTTSTQTDDSIPFDSHQVVIKEETKSHAKLKDLIVFEQDAEIKTEIDEDKDSETFDSYEEIKIEIGETEILPYLQSTKTVLPKTETKQDGGTICIQANLEKIDDTATSASTKRSLPTNIDDTSTEPKKRKVDESIQTDRVIVFPIESEDWEDSINPEDCTCKSNYADMTREQFYRSCTKFLSPNFSAIVRKQIFLDSLIKKIDTSK